MKNVIVIISLFLCNFAVCMEPAEKIPSLNALMLIDITAGAMKKLEENAVVSAFMKGLDDKIPIIATTDIVFQAITDKELTISTEWLIFKDTSGQIAIFIPKNYNPLITTKDDLIKIGINAAYLENIPLGDMKEAFKRPLFSFNIANLANIFSRESNVRKRFIVVGHGLSTQEAYGQFDPKRQIAGLKIEDYKTLLELFNTINVDFVYLISCYAGGRNLLEPYEKNLINGTVNVNLKYFLMVTALTDTTTMFEKYADYNQFFMLVDQFFSPTGLQQENPFEAFYNAMKPSDIYGIPAVRFPGSINYFKAVNAQDRIEIITYAKMQAKKIGPRRAQLSVEEKKMFASAIEARRSQKETSPEDILKLESLLKEKARQIKPEDEPFKIDIKKEAILIYPMHIITPIILDNAAVKMPALLSMIPGNAFHLFDQFNAQSISLKIFILDGIFNNKIASEKIFLFQVLLCSNFENSGIEYKPDNQLFLHKAMIKKGAREKGGTILFEVGNIYYRANINYINEKAILDKFKKITQEQAIQEIKKTISELETTEKSLIQASGGQESITDIKSIIEQDFLSGKKIIQKSYAPESFIDAIKAKNYTEIKKMINEGISVNKTRSGKVPLIEAAKTMDQDLIKLLLEKKADVNEEDRDQKNALQYAIYNKDLPIISLLIDKGVNLDKQDEFGSTPLMHAIATNQEEAAKLLINKGASLKKFDNLGRSVLDIAQAPFSKSSPELVSYLERVGAEPGVAEKLSKTSEVNRLSYAVSNKDYSFINYLLEKGTDINRRDSSYRTALLVAIENNDVQMAKFLLDHGANPKLGLDDQSALAYAIEVSDIPEIIELLIQKGVPLPNQIKYESLANYLLNNSSRAAIIPSLIKGGFNINQKDNEGNSLLSKSIYINKPLAKVLIENGADLTMKNREGNTPLMVAINSNNLEIIQMLIKNKVDVNQISRDESPLIAAINMRNSEIVEMLLEAGADPEFKNSEGKTAVDIAQELGDINIIELLIKKGLIKKEIKEPESLITVIFNNPELAKEMIEKGADLSIQNEFQTTPLLAAIFANNLDLIRLLIKHGADVNQLGGENLSPLIAAIESENPDPQIIELLLNAGADPNYKNEEGKTALDIAKELGNTDIINLFKS